MLKLDKISSPQAALVTWIDTSLLSGWFDSGDEIEPTPLKMQTLGWLIHKDKKAIILAMTASEYKFGELLIIPAGCVKSVAILPPDKGTDA